MNRRTALWTFGPCVLLSAFVAAVAQWVPEGVDADIFLLVEQLTVSAALALVTLAAARSRMAGWRARMGYSWLWLAGPLWLVVVSPIGIAVGNIAAAPGRAALWFAASLFIALNEETIFRGFLLTGLRRAVGPVRAAVLSSVAFGLLHVLNALWGADTRFLGAQVIAAIGTGLVLAVMTLRVGSIWPAVFLHFAADAMGLSAMGGFAEALDTAEAAGGMIAIGAIGGSWGLFWLWFLARRGRFDEEAESVQRA